MTGTLVYDPTIIATGKNRRAILRKYAHEMFIQCLKYYPEMHGYTLKTFKPYLDIYVKDSLYWLRDGNKAASEQDLTILEQIFVSMIGTVMQRKIDPESLVQLYKEFRADLEIKSNSDEQWCILKVDPKVVQPQLDDFRKAGMKISGSAWGPHISVIRNESIGTHSWLLSKDKNKTIDFEIGKLRSNTKGYYWYDVTSPGLEQVRLELSLSPRPTPPFHLTIGKIV